MKRSFLFLLALITLNSCSIDDDAPNINYELAQITGNNLPDEFVFNDTYSITIDYILPSECHNFAGIDARRAGNTSADRRKIYVGVVSTVEVGSECEENGSGDTGSTSFSILIDELEDYTFYFWTGVGTNNQPEYTEVVVPVVEASTP